MVFLESALGAVIEAATQRVLDLAGRRRKREVVPELRAFSAGLAVHLKEALTWASQVQSWGLSEARSTETTIALQLHTEPRPFRGEPNVRKVRSENDILTTPGHFMLLGDPGAGKTTTLKRLTLRVLLEPPSTEEETCQYPVVIRLRELPRGASIYTAICDALRISYRQVDIGRGPQNGPKSRSAIHYVTKVGDANIQDFVSDFLDNTQALLLLDGLDELKPGLKARFRTNLQALAMRLSSAKMVASSRSGEHSSPMEGFRSLEILPLGKAEIVSIARAWLGTAASSFLKCLEALPYYDLADRPLLLSQLLFLYQRYGYLPAQPSEIYRRVVRLLLEEWDAQKGIVRSSRYSGFSADRKLDFLCVLSYHLTKAWKKQFSERDLVGAYEKICETFGLPRGEALQVAQELQTHNGIIVTGSEDCFEFSHLSLQEYLCAMFLVRAPFPGRIGTNPTEYAAPLAVAVSLSSRPSDWFAQIVLRLRDQGPSWPDWIVTFLARVMLEQPAFEVSDLLGIAVLRLFFLCTSNSSAQEMVSKFAAGPVVAKSVAAGLSYYAIRPVHPRRGPLVGLVARGGGETADNIPPRMAAVPRRALRELVAMCSTPIYWLDSEGSIHALDARVLDEIEEEDGA